MSGTRSGGLKAAQKTYQATRTFMLKSDERAALLHLQATEVVKDSHKILNAIAT